MLSNFFIQLEMWNRDTHSIDPPFIHSTEDIFYPEYQSLLLQSQSYIQYFGSIYSPKIAPGGLCWTKGGNRDPAGLPLSPQIQMISRLCLLISVCAKGIDSR